MLPHSDAPHARLLCLSLNARLPICAASSENLRRRIHLSYLIFIVAGVRIDLHMGSGNDPLIGRP
jgi:hypothetical protein